MALFGPGVVLIPPDKESALLPYVPGVIMAQADGSVVGAVPNTVVATSDGAVLGDGTMGFNDHLTPFHFRTYDTDFNALGDSVVFAPSGVRTSPPAPCSDFVQWFYVASLTTPKQIRRVSKLGVVDGTTWTLASTPVCFAVANDNATLWWADGTAIHAHDLLTDTALPDLVPAAAFGADFAPGVSMRVVPTLGTLAAFVVNATVAPFTVELWQFTTVSGPPGPPAGTVLTKTPLPYLSGNTDPTMQVDVGAPATVIWTRGYGGDFDRQDGSTFNLVRLSDGVSLIQWTQTIAEVDGGVPGGILPATCPLIAWSSVVVGPPACAVGIPSPPPTATPACAPSGISGGQG